ncbi:MAG: 2-hydroxyacyl-CoA dehydratase [Deltaproteobacteria bacterium]|nr:2-hydroxyacyl-CoA dehydratase [Deltaproteobacteria bacterium]
MSPMAEETAFKGERSKKALNASIEATKFHKNYYEEAKQRAARGEAVILANVGIPMEILHAMDIPVIFNPHWSAVCAAKQVSERYLTALNRRGYFRDLGRYCSLPLGYFFDDRPEDAPWGGLPRPTAVVMDPMCDPLIKIGDIMSREVNIPYYVWDRGMIAQPPRKNIWESVDDIEAYSYEEPWRIDFAVRETEGLIAFAEAVSGKSLQKDKLREAMDRSTEQFEYIEKTMDLAATVPTPMRMGDHMANLISTQFYRGHKFGLAQAKRLYEEVKERVEQGVSAYENERIRLMYSGVPNWFSPGFYDSFEEKYGAVFAWMGYLTLVPKSLMRKDASDPVRAAAARYVHYGTELQPPWFPRILVHEAKKFRIDGVVYSKVESCRYLSGSLRLAVRALERSGIPTFEHDADMVDSRDWDDTRVKGKLASFIETLAERRR